MAEAKLMAMSFKAIGFGFQNASDRVLELLNSGLFSTSSVWGEPQMRRMMGVADKPINTKK